MIVQGIRLIAEGVRVALHWGVTLFLEDIAAVLRDDNTPEGQDLKKLLAHLGLKTRLFLPAPSQDDDDTQKPKRGRPSNAERAEREARALAQQGGEAQP